MRAPRTTQQSSRAEPRPPPFTRLWDAAARGISSSSFRAELHVEPTVDSRPTFCLYRPAAAVAQEQDESLK